MQNTLDTGLAPSAWCGIVVVGIGAAALLVNLWAGLAVLLVGGGLVGRACYRDVRDS